MNRNWLRGQHQQIQEKPSQTETIEAKLLCTQTTTYAFPKGASSDPHANQQFSKESIEVVVYLPPPDRQYLSASPMHSWHLPVQFKVGGRPFLVPEGRRLQFARKPTLEAAPPPANPRYPRYGSNGAPMGGNRENNLGDCWFFS